MSILNMPSEGTANVLLALYRYVVSEKAVPRQKLLSVCAPDVVCEPKNDSRTGTQAGKTLNTWVKMGLFTEDDEGTVRLVPDVPRDEGALQPWLRALIFRPEHNDPFWGSEGVRSADLTRGLAWCLALDPFRLDGQGFKAVDELELHTLPRTVEVFRNDTRWNGFRVWARFLGFAWQARYPKKSALVLDPTPAIRDTLPAVFGPAAELTQKDFLARLREHIPVLDGGTYRRTVEEQLLPGRWPEPKPGELSASLSLALQRLKVEGVIDFENRADPAAGRVTLTGRNGRPTTPVSHVVYKGVAA